MTLAELAKRMEEITGPIVKCPEGHEFYKNYGPCDVCESVDRFIGGLPFAGKGKPVIYIRRGKP